VWAIKLLLCTALPLQFQTGLGPLGQLAGYLGNMPSEQYFTGERADAAA
jgi:hypothetical protein